MAAVVHLRALFGGIKQTTKYVQYTQVMNYVKPKLTGKTTVAAAQKVELEVETDPEKLVTHCCGANIYVGGEDPLLKPDNEYPDWLWNLRLDREPIPLSELDQDTYEYWRRLRSLKLREITMKKRPYKLK